MTARWQPDPADPPAPPLLETAGVLLYVALWLFLIGGGWWLAGTLVP